jgi:hypothetical protein
MPKIQEFYDEIPIAVSDVIKQRLTLALLANTIPAVSLKLNQESKPMQELEQNDLVRLLEFCESNYPDESQSVLDGAKSKDYAPLFLLKDALPDAEQQQWVMALRAIQESNPLNEPLPSLSDKHISSVNKKIIGHASHPKPIKNTFPMYNNVGENILAVQQPILPHIKFFSPNNKIDPVVLHTRISVLDKALQPRLFALFDVYQNAKLTHKNEKIRHIEGLLDSEIKYADTLTLKNPIMQKPFDDVIDVNTIVVLTEIVHNTLGDFFAAKRLIAAIKKQFPDIRIVWLIMEENKTISLEELPNAEVHLFSAWGELFYTPQLNIACNAVLAVKFPALPYLTEILFAYINIRRMIKGIPPIVDILEYDYPMYASGEHTTLHTGFGPKALGIFLEEPLPADDEALATTIQSHAGMATLFAGQTVAEYRRSYVCYFGYRNKELCRTSNRLSSYYFVSAVIALQSARKNTKNIDIIVPLLDEERLRLVNWTYLEFFSAHNITAIHFIGKEGTTVVTVPESDPQGCVLRLFHDVFPMPHNVFKAVIHFAERDLIMCTGDQSFSDVLIVPGAIPLYQIMTWKEWLYEQFCNLVQQVCGHCALSAYFSILKKYSDPLFIGRYIATRADVMQQQMLAVQQHLRAHKNLFDTLPLQLIAMVEEFKAKQDQDAQGLPLVRS